MPTRRALRISTVMAATSPLAGQSQEDVVYFIDLPPKTTLWGAVMFFSDELVEVTVATAKDERRVRGRFRGQRLAEHSWTNNSPQPQRVAIRARAVGANRELPNRNVRYTAGESLLIGFGTRPLPSDPREREGVYPHEAVFVGFILFGGD